MFEKFLWKIPQKNPTIAYPPYYVFAGYCKANRANKLIGRGTRSSVFVKGFSKAFVHKCRKHMFENVLKKSFGESLRKIRRPYTPTYTFIGPADLAVASDRIIGSNSTGYYAQVVLQKLYIAKGESSRTSRRNCYTQLSQQSITGYWKANRANNLIGRGTRSSDLPKGFSKGICSSDSIFVRKVLKNCPWEISQKNPTIVYLPPIISVGPVGLPVPSTKYVLTP